MSHSRPSALSTAQPSRPSRQERADGTTAALEAACTTTDPAVRHQLLDDVVRLNMGVARAIAHRYRNRGIDEADLEQVAYLALVRAARKFDLEQHSDFLSYAVPTIRGELKKHFRDHGWTVRPPRRIQEMQARIAAARQELYQTLGRSPRPSDLATHLGEDVHEIVDALATEGAFRPASLDQPLNVEDGTASLGDLIGDDDLGQEAAEARAMLARVIHRLSERDRHIVRLRYFEQFTQQEIADDIGVTQMHVSRLLSRIHGDLRGALTQSETPAPAGTAGLPRQARQGDRRRSGHPDPARRTGTRGPAPRPVRVQG
ncbi:sigma-70 family RNA polymerase sigma factor [Nocardioides mesophilus]|uniref:Sigma-70 family RNA polymerase sigma factor n=1 Tax=Nocardioides mesophilus TaxID=433659 RepID=A0A7G9R8I1_9ACTN|nr:sigma-70 family RNA polymerase sigma factor [Nocardioides mesophilus]QNN51906.1 sigma-70 family RNA polymerase sigma factor [Nocardioides mesophilus]